MAKAIKLTDRDGQFLLYHCSYLNKIETRHRTQNLCNIKLEFQWTHRVSSVKTHLLDFIAPLDDYYRGINIECIDGGPVSGLIFDFKYMTFDLSSHGIVLTGICNF